MKAMNWRWRRRSSLPNWESGSTKILESGTSRRPIRALPLNLVFLSTGKARAVVRVSAVYVQHVLSGLAVSLGDQAALDIDLVRDGLKVVRAHATRVATEVVNHQVVRDLAASQF